MMPSYIDLPNSRRFMHTQALYCRAWTQKGRTQTGRGLCSGGTSRVSIWLPHKVWFIAQCIFYGSRHDGTRFPGFFKFKKYMLRTLWTWHCDYDYQHARSDHLTVNCRPA